MTKSDRIIVVATHPDDETYGAAGTLHRFKTEGASIFWLIVTGIHEENGWKTDRVLSRRAEINKVAGLLSFNHVFNLEIPTTTLCEVSRGQLIASIAAVFSEVKPTHVILPFRGDPHSDHRVAFEAAYACTKTFRYPSIKNIWMMEVQSETDFALPGNEYVFTPDLFVDVTGHLSAKEEAALVYESEIGRHPFPRSIEAIRALALMRGIQAGVEHAEAFMNIKTIM